MNQEIMDTTIEMSYSLGMKTYSFQTIIEKDGKQYHGFVPALPGCHTFGKTIEATKKNLADAMQGYLLACIKHNDPIPEDTGFHSIQTISIPSRLRTKKSYA